MKNKNNIILIVSLVLLSLILSMSSSAYYTNMSKYLEDSRKPDGYTGYALERTSDEFIVDGCGSGTMLDTITSLCWEKNMSSGGIRQWSTDTSYLEPIWDNVTKTYTYPSSGKANYSAFAYCEDLSLGGNDDWRVPGKIEILTLVDQIGLAGSTCTSLQSFGFTNCQNAGYWASKEYKGVATWSWYVHINFGLSSQDVKNVVTRYVVCVR